MSFGSITIFPLPGHRSMTLACEIVASASAVMVADVRILCDRLSWGCLRRGCHVSTYIYALSSAIVVRMSMIAGPRTE